MNADILDAHIKLIKSRYETLRKHERLLKEQKSNLKNKFESYLFGCNLSFNKIMLTNRLQDEAVDICGIMILENQILSDPEILKHRLNEIESYSKKVPFKMYLEIEQEMLTTLRESFLKVLPNQGEEIVNRFILERKYINQIERFPMTIDFSYSTTLY